MLHYALTFVMLWLLLLDVPTTVMAVCTHCFGNVEGCSGDSAKCPLVTTTAKNVAALAATTAGILSVAVLLPSKVVRAFPRTVLDTLVAIASAPKPGTSFDFTGKTTKQIFDAVMHGHTTANEALMELNRLMLDAADEADVTKIGKTMDTIKTLDKTKSIASGHQGSSDGILLYIWAMTEKCISDMASVVLVPLDDDKDKDSTRAALTAKLGRPSSLSDFVSRLNTWVMVCHATGAANILISTPFLEDVVYAHLRKGADWKVVHELFLIYLHAVEATAKYNLANVFETGGQDTKWAEAKESAAKCFRIGGEKPRSGSSKPWNCAFDPNATSFCNSYNLMRDHPESSIGSDGRCKFLHKCDKFIVDAAGKKCGKCESTKHGRVKCDNPARMQHKEGE